MVGKPQHWTLLEGTVHDLSDPTSLRRLNLRTKDRGTVASILQSLTFALGVNHARTQCTTHAVHLPSAYC